MPQSFYKPAIERLEGDAPEEPFHLSPVALRDGAKLWQLNDIEPDILYSLLREPGIILHLSSNFCILFSPDEQFYTIELYSGDRSVKYQRAGPQFEVCFERKCPLYKWSLDSIPFSAQVYVRETCLPLQGSDLVQVQLVFDMLLRFLTGLPRPEGENRQVTFTKSPCAKYAIDPNEITYSPEVLRVCFAQDGWGTDGSITFGCFDCEFGQLSSTLLANLEEFTFRSIRFNGLTIPRSFIERTRSSCVVFYDSQLELDSSRSNGISSARLEVYAPRDTLLSVQDVDDFIAKWMTATGTLELGSAAFSEESWAYFWRCISTDSGVRTLAHSVTVTRVRINGKYLCHEHIAAVSKNAWLIEWADPISRDGGTIHARRILSSMPDTAMAFFRPQHNPLFGQDPPMDARQSVILEALLHSSHNPNQHYTLARTYAHTLLQPQTRAARAHDTETSLVELRALGIDHQQVIDLLLEANSNLQQRCAKTGSQLMEVTRQLEQERKEREEEKRQRREWERRQEVRNEAVLTQIQTLNRRVRIAEQFGERGDY